MWAGLGVGLVGIAAAAGIFFYMQASKKQPPPPQAQDDSAQTAPKVKEVSDEAEPTKPAPQGDQAPVAKDDDKAVDINKLGDATSAPVVPGGPLPKPADHEVATDDSKKGPHKILPDGTLDDEMKKTVGPEDQKEADKPDPAAGTPKNLPDNPPQGAVTAGMSSAKGAARACVQGAEGDSSATVTFGSSGAAQSVSVGGWAAGKPAADCIKGALKGANVGPFSKPTFTVTVTIRP